MIWIENVSLQWFERDDGCIDNIQNLKYHKRPKKGVNTLSSVVTDMFAEMTGGEHKQRHVEGINPRVQPTKPLRKLVYIDKMPHHDKPDEYIFQKVGIVISAAIFNCHYLCSSIHKP